MLMCRAKCGLVLEGGGGGWRKCVCYILFCLKKIGFKVIRVGNVIDSVINPQRTAAIYEVH